MVAIELIIFLSTILPVFHLLNALLARKKSFKPISRSEIKMSVLIPCYNEEDTISSSIKGLLGMKYKNYEAVYINDGSIDNTLGVLNKELDLEELSGAPFYRKGIKSIYRSRKYENFFVVDKSNGGKSGALNVGTYFAKGELIVTLDADSILDTHALAYMNRLFITNEKVVAAGGTIHVVQGYDPLLMKDKQKDPQQKRLIALQILEYLKGFYIYKYSLGKQNALAIISGAFGVFKRDILLKVGGYRKTVGEDIDITLRIHQLIQKTDKMIVFLPEALCYTQCPENLSSLKKQRIRWQKGFIDCAFYHKGFLLKTFLFKSLSFHFLFDALFVGSFSCFFTVLSYLFTIILSFVNHETFFLFFIYFLFCMAFNIFYSFASIAVSQKNCRYPKETMKKVYSAILMDILFYRYFNLAMFIFGTVSYLWNEKEKNDWNKFARSKGGLYEIKKEDKIYG